MTSAAPRPTPVQGGSAGVRLVPLKEGSSDEARFAACFDIFVGLM